MPQAALDNLKSPIVFTARPDLREAIRAELKELGAVTIVTPPNREACIEALIRNSDAVLVLDWAVGPEDGNQILAAIKGHFHVETRPVVLIVGELNEQMVATGAEYGISQLHSGPVSRSSLKSCLSAVLREDAQTREVKAMLVQVATARSRGDWTVATPILLELHEKYPHNDRVATELGENLIQEGAWDHASQVLEPFAKADPPYIRALHLMGRCAMAHGDADRAIGLLERAKVLNPHNVERLIELGQAFLSVDCVEDAKTNFDEAAAIDPENKEAKVGQGQCHLMAGEVNEALSLLKEVSGPRELASIFNTSAVLAMRHTRYEQGMSLYKSALIAVGRDEKIAARLFFNMGIGFKRWGKPDRAATCFAKSLELDPTYVKAAKQKDVIAKVARPAPQETEVQEAGFDEEQVVQRTGTDGGPHAPKQPAPTAESVLDKLAEDDFDIDE